MVGREAPNNVSIDTDTTKKPANIRAIMVRPHKVPMHTNTRKAANIRAIMVRRVAPYKVPMHTNTRKAANRTKRMVRQPNTRNPRKKTTLRYKKNKKYSTA